ncbi:MAG: shikimate kinase [Dehalococcoidales bacterium]|nr:shikimate kinase [Dehalococcoidales bacterium]
MKTSVALIGFMGTGKTVVGKLLAEKLDKEFIELDAVIEKKAGKSIPEIFRQDGEIGFRELEIEATGEVAIKKNAVIACGGGIVLNKINIDRLRKECVIICLMASSQVIIKRTSADTDERPLLAVPDRTRQIEELMKFREPYYKRSADVTINTSRISAYSVVEKIMEKLKENES